MNPQFELPGGALALLGGKSHVLADVPLVRRRKTASLVHGPFHVPEGTDCPRLDHPKVRPTPVRDEITTAPSAIRVSVGNVRRPEAFWTSSSRLPPPVDTRCHNGTLE